MGIFNDTCANLVERAVDDVEWDTIWNTSTKNVGDACIQIVSVGIEHCMPCSEVVSETMYYGSILVDKKVIFSVQDTYFDDVYFDLKSFFIKIAVKGKIKFADDEYEIEHDAVEHDDDEAPDDDDDDEAPDDDDEYIDAEYDNFCDLVKLFDDIRQFGICHNSNIGLFIVKFPIMDDSCEIRRVVVINFRGHYDRFVTKFGGELANIETAIRAHTISRLVLSHQI